MPKKDSEPLLCQEENCSRPGITRCTECDKMICLDHKFMYSEPRKTIVCCQDCKEGKKGRYNLAILLLFGIDFFSILTI